MFTPEYDLTNHACRKRIKNGFPGFMDQRPHSTNQKILDLIARITNVYKNDWLYITDQMNVNNASGQILTDIANDYGIERIDDDDEFLRFEVKFQMWKNTLGAGRNDFNNIIHFILGVQPNQFNIIQTGVKEFKITNIPWNFDSGDKARLKRDMISSIIQYVAPPEFLVDYIEYQKTVNDTNYIGDSTAHTKYIRVYPKPMILFRKYFHQSYHGDYAYYSTSFSKGSRFRPNHLSRHFPHENNIDNYTYHLSKFDKSSRFKPTDLSKHFQYNNKTNDYTYHSSKFNKGSRFKK